jgi:hypothetical protein
VNRVPTRRVAVVAVIAAVVGVTAWVCVANRTPTAMLGVVVAPGNAALQAFDQGSASGELLVDRVLAPGGSWVVVTTPATVDASAAVVGLAHVPAGVSRGVKVPLGPGVRLNQRLVVTLHADRGIPGRFEFDPARFDVSPDKPYSVSGAPLSVAVVKDTTVRSLAEAAGTEASAEPSAAAGQALLSIAPRLTVLNRLVVDRVVAPGPSWVAIYLVDDEGVPGELAGVVRVAAGESVGVAVPIEIDRELTDKLLVALHADGGVAGRFEFSASDFARSPDKPYASGGSEVSWPVLLRGFGMSNDNMVDNGGAGM